MYFSSCTAANTHNNKIIFSFRQYKAVKLCYCKNYYHHYQSRNNKKHKTELYIIRINRIGNKTFLYIYRQYWLTDTYNVIYIILIKYRIILNRKNTYNEIIRNRIIRNKSFYIISYTLEFNIVYKLFLTFWKRAFFALDIRKNNIFWRVYVIGNIICLTFNINNSGIRTIHRKISIVFFCLNTILCVFY